MIKSAFSTGLFILIALIFGATLGINTDLGTILSDYLDYLVLALVFIVFLDIPMEDIVANIKQPKIIFVAWITNFLILPFLGFGITKIFLPEQNLLALGLAIYFMSPCTDWFLGFTRMAQGNTGVGSILIPINMITQLLLYPFWIEYFSQQTLASASSAEIANILIHWFIVPAGAALIIRLFLGTKFHVFFKKSYLSNLNNWLIYALVFVIFLVNVQQIADNLSIFGRLLLSVLVFFTIGLALTEISSKIFKLTREDHVLYTITTSARNAPLMLGLSMTALPNQPLVYTAIIIGMLIEFPYLALLVLRFKLAFARKAKNAF